MPQIVQTHVHRPNAPAQAPEDYYKINLTENFLALITLLNEKLAESTLITDEGFSIIPNVLVEHIKNQVLEG